MKLQYSKGQVPKQAHVAIPEGLYEEEHGRQGFFGPVSQFYRLHPPTDWKRIEGPLQPRAFNTYSLKPTDLDDPRGEPVRVLYNNDVALFISRRAEPMPFCFRNGDGDEVHFIHQGRGVLQSDFGPLQYSEGDYVVIPKGTNYRVVPETRDNFTLIVQSRGPIDFPERAGIGHYAPFDYDVIETPRLPLQEARRQVEASLAVVAHLLSPTRQGAMVHNARCALLAGIAMASGKAVLLLQEGQVHQPIDYRDVVTAYTNPQQVPQFLEPFIKGVITRLQDSGPRAARIPEGFLERLNLGDLAAENEILALKTYFVRTSQYNEARRGNARRRSRWTR